LRQDHYQHLCLRLRDLGNVVCKAAAPICGDFLAEALLAELGDQAGGDGDAEVGLDQRVLELVERLLVELLGEAGDALGDALGRFGRPGAARQPTLLVDFLLVAFSTSSRSSVSGVSLAGPPPKRNRQPALLRASFSTSTSSGLASRSPGHLRTAAAIRLALESDGNTTRHQHVVVRSHSIVSVRLIRRPPCAAGRAGPPHGRQAAGERDAGAALPDAQAGPASGRPIWRAREKRSCSSFGPSSVSGIDAASSTKVACGCPCWCPRDHEGPNPIGM
jgi:hypothetical protein